MRYTPGADAELVVYGDAVRAPAVPVSPTGTPTPAVVTRAAREVLGFETSVVDAGLLENTGAPTIAVGASAGEDVREADPVPTGPGSFTAAVQLGRALPDDHLVLGETIPGGTTTALGVLQALGEDVEVSSSLATNPIERKHDVVAAGLDASGLEPGDCAGDPRRAIRRMGDPVQAALAGVVVGALETGARVTLAGGTQLLAVAALVRHDGVDAGFRIATTSYVADDDAVGFRTAARDLDLDVTVTDPGSTPSTSGSVGTLRARRRRASAWVARSHSPTPRGTRGGPRARPGGVRSCRLRGPRPRRWLQVRPDAVDDAERVPTAARASATSWSSRRTSIRVDRRAFARSTSGLSTTRRGIPTTTTRRSATRPRRTSREPRRSTWGRRRSYRRRVDLPRSGSRWRRRSPRATAYSFRNRRSASTHARSTSRVRARRSSPTTTCFPSKLGLRRPTTSTSATIALPWSATRTIRRGRVRRRGAPRVRGALSGRRHDPARRRGVPRVHRRTVDGGRTRRGRRPVAHEAVRVAGVARGVRGRDRSGARATGDGATRVESWRAGRGGGRALSARRGVRRRDPRPRRERTRTRPRTPPRRRDGTTGRRALRPLRRRRPRPSRRRRWLSPARRRGPGRDDVPRPGLARSRRRPRARGERRAAGRALAAVVDP